MKEEKGKTLLQPSFTQQQQQTQHTKTTNSTNNMTNKHKQQKEDGHQQWPDYQYQPIFQDFKRTINPEEEEEEQHQHFQHSIQS